MTVLASEGIKISIEIVLVDTVFPCVHMKVTDNASNIKKAFGVCVFYCHSNLVWTNLVDNAT